MGPSKCPESVWRFNMSCVVWITGLPGSGKSSIAEALKGRHPGFVILRMDEMRKIVTPEPTYNDMERELVYRSLVYMAKKISELGHPVIIDATGNLRRWRELAKELIPEFFEVYLKCSLRECEQRESMRKDRHAAPGEIYGKGRKGWPVPGVTVPYEEPLSPDVTVDTEHTGIDEALNIIEGGIKCP